MKRIQDVIQEAEDRLFVGREQELALMENILLDQVEPWRYLHFYGPSGIGKTTLLRSFIRKASDYEVLYFDRIGTFPKAEEFLEMVGSILSEKGFMHKAKIEQDNLNAVIECLNELAVQKKLVILIFDSYEQWTLLDDWLRETWIPLLVPEVRVCSAGQFPLKNSRSISSGWDEIIQNVEIQPLTKNDVKTYAGMKGINDLHIQDEIERFSNGFPLTLSLACEVVLNRGHEKLMDSPHTRVAIGTLIEKTVKDMNNGLFQKLLDITSLLWRFDQDLLSVIVDEQISTKSFREFCQLPFISVCDRGWSLHDVVRRWIKLDIANRAPEKYTLYRTKALKELRRREMVAAGKGKRNFSVEKLYLYENDWIQNYLFNAHGEGVSIRPMHLNDLPEVENIYRLWSLNTAPYIEDDTHQEKLIRPLLELVPSAFSTVWYEDMLIGFHSFVPLHEATQSVFLQHPVFSNYLKQTKRTDREYLIWIGGIKPGFERNVMGAQLRHLLYCFADANRIIGIGSNTDLKRVLQSMGFEQIQGYDDKTQNEALHWHAVQLNLREEDYFTWLDKLLESMSINTSVNVEDKTAFIKKILIHFHSLEQQTDIVESSHRILQLPICLEGESQAVLLRNYLLKAIEEMPVNEPGVAELQRILQLAYIQKIGSHEVVAERLKMSTSTYYRYLKKAIEKVTINL